MAAVVVTDQLDWRLHGFDLLSEHAGGGDELPIINASWMVGSQYKPGEVTFEPERKPEADLHPGTRQAWKLFVISANFEGCAEPYTAAQPHPMVAPQVGKGEWSSIPQSPPWAVDAWGLGCLLHETFSGQRLLRAEDLRQTASIPPGILQVPLK